MLGNLAFQDKAYVSVDKVGIGSTFVDSGTAGQILQVYGGGAYVSGNLGVGVTNPASKLESATNNSSGDYPIRATNTSTANNVTKFVGYEFFAYDTAGTGKRVVTVDAIPLGSNWVNSVLAFSTRNSDVVSEKARIDNIGNILVGTTTSTGTASQLLQVSGGAYVSGSVGIGSTNPTAKLDVQGGNGFVRIGEVFSGYNGITLNNSTVSSQYNILSSASDQTLYINRPTGNNIRFRSGNGDQMMLNASGELLVGTTTSTGTASQLLQVSGGVYVSGSVGIGTTNPLSASSQLHINNSSYHGVSGDALLRLVGVGGATYIQSGITATSGSSAPIVFTNIFANNEWARFTPSGNFLIGAATSTGTASQRLQVTGGGYVSGNLGVGVTNPSSRIDAYSSTSGSTAIRATSSPFFSANVFPGVIAGLSTNAASANSAQFAAAGMGLTSGEIGVYSFYPTFANFPADLGPRRAVDLVGGFSTGVWGTEYFSINVGRNGASNDSSILTSEKLRITASGNVGIGTTNPVGQLQVSSGPVIIGAATSTGTSGQVLQVAGINSSVYIGGNLGVGNTNTSFKFEVQGGSARFVQLAQGDLTITHSNLVSSIRGVTSVQLALGANNNDVIRINNSGNVGIGTTTPTSTLTVQGNALISGVATVTSNFTVDSGTLYVDATNNRVGINTLSPSFTADIAGDARVTSTNKMRFGGTAGTTNFYIQYNSTANSLDFVAG
jgi:hypothetical protein